MIKIGQGFDVHAFCDGEALVLGGVKIPFQYAFKAHSDGDVLIHALCDALLGALALGDIGQHFPDTDAAYRGADSRVLLRRVMQLVRERGYRLGNADMTIVAQAPKMAPHIEAMRGHLAADLALDTTCISVKATTSERLGFTGRGEGIAAYATVLLLAEGA